MSQVSLDHPEDLLPWYVNNTLQDEERQRVKEHLGFCLSCRRQVRQLEALRSDVQATDEEPPGVAGLERLVAALDAASPRTATLQSKTQQSKTQPAKRRQWMGPRLQLAAAALLALSLGSLVYRTWDVAPPVQRAQPGEEAVLRSLVPQGQSLSRGDFVLQWNAAGVWAGAGFNLYLTTTDLRAVYEVRGLEGTECRVPSEVFAQLPPATRLLWRFEAVRSDGEAERSETFLVLLE